MFEAKCGQCGAFALGPWNLHMSCFPEEQALPHAYPPLVGGRTATAAAATRASAACSPFPWRTLLLHKAPPPLARAWVPGATLLSPRGASAQL